MNSDEFTSLWDADFLKRELEELFGSFKEEWWTLDPGIDERYNEAAKTGELDSFHENEKGFLYQSAWNQATNEERAKYLAILKYAMEHDYRSALDYGFGNGAGVVTLALGGLDSVVGVEVNNHHKELLKARRSRWDLNNITVLSANAKGRWDWHRQEVDLVVCTEVFEHVAEPETLAEELYEIINPGGAAILSWSFVAMPGHVQEHFHLQASHPDTFLTEGFGAILQEIGFVYDKHTWFTNSAWRVSK